MPDPTNPAQPQPIDDDTTAVHDVVVIGGGAAGLSAAVAVARFDRSVVVVDDATPRTAPAGHVHNLLSRDGIAPAELYRVGREEIVRFGGRIVDGTVAEVHGSRGAFTVRLDDGRTIVTRRIVAATGGRDVLPDVPGLADRWGRDVLHCGFCHGYEVRGQRIGVLATGPMASHQAMMFRLLSPHVTLLSHTAPPTVEQADDLARRGIAIIAGEVTAVTTVDDRLTGVELADGGRVEVDALVVASSIRARADYVAPLGLEPVEFVVNGLVLGTRIETAPNGATSVPGVWVAGNTAEPMAQVVGAAAHGLAVGAAIIGDIMTNDG